MSHECEDCGQGFDTLTRLRLHDCSSSDEPVGETADSPGAGDSSSETTPEWEDRRPEAVEVEQLDELLDDSGDGESEALYGAIATYESELESASAADASDRYRGIKRAYRKRLITELDEATQREGWGFLEGFVDAYQPDSAERFPHVTTILQNVTARYLIRTRLADGVEAIPVVALEYFERIRTEVEPGYDFVIEGLHPYGWGIGHPDFAVADKLHAHASKDVFSTSPMLEHAFYADQHRAVELLERIVRDDSMELAGRPGEEIPEARYLLDAPAGAASDEYWPTIPRYWDWHEQLAFDFELEENVEQRIRDLVREAGLDDDLPRDWEITDLTM